jgi:glyoxylase-like metal-dependent hydrolase (beta-lactamase superfamily II)
MTTRRIAMTASLHIQSLLSLPFGQNTYVIWQEGRSEALVIDPGLQPELILDFLRQKGLTAAALLCTHGHADHIGGNAALKAAYPQAPLLIGAGDEVMLHDTRANLSAQFGLPLTSPPADRLVREGDVLDLAGIRLEVLEIPGHSPGHVAFLYRAIPSIVFGGDILFQGSVGRVDFPGGSANRLLSGIRDKLFSLPDDTVVYPGHGPATTIAEEKRHNPFVGEMAVFEE